MSTLARYQGRCIECREPIIEDVSWIAECTRWGTFIHENCERAHHPVARIDCGASGINNQAEFDSARWTALADMLDYLTFDPDDETLPEAREALTNALRQSAKRLSGERADANAG